MAGVPLGNFRVAGGQPGNVSFADGVGAKGGDVGIGTDSGNDFARNVGMERLAGFHIAKQDLQMKYIVIIPKLRHYAMAFAQNDGFVTMSA